MPISLAHDGAAIVLLGSFNPAIFQPAWFSANGLISVEQASAAQSERLIVTREATSFTAEWLELQVTQDRFQSVTRDTTAFLPLRDFVLGTFAVLEHTPFFRMGLNRVAHFQVASLEQWHKFGHLLAPKAHWQSLFSGHIGMRSITIEGQRPDRAPESSGALRRTLRIKVEPSAQVLPGVFVECNEDIASPDKDSPPQQRALLDILGNDWPEWISYTDDAIEQLVALSKAQAP